MIKQHEAKDQANGAVSVDDFTALEATSRDFSYKAVIEQYGPDWTYWNQVSGFLYHDAVKTAGYIVRVYVSSGTWIIDRLRADESGWQSLALSEVIAPVNGLISLAATGNAVSLFYATATEIRVVTCSDITVASPSFGASSLVLTQSGVVGVAGLSTSKVYFAYLSAQNNRILAVLNYANSAWTKTDSDIRWPFPFNSFDAISINDRDVIAFSGDLPPLWGTRAIGTVVKSEFSRVQGIVLFTVHNGHWSDYRTFDVIDRDVFGYGRTELRMTVDNGIAFMTYNRHMIFHKYLADGSIIMNGNSTRLAPSVSRSKNGTDWEFPEPVLLPRSPFLILSGSTYLYAVSGRTHRSHACAWGGMTPRSQDVSNYVIDISSNAGDIRSTSLELANPFAKVGQTVQPILKETLADSSMRLWLKLYLGYFVDEVEEE